MVEAKVDYKKKYKDIYLPKTEPVKIYVPAMTYIMIEGKGNPNEEGGEYSKALELLYGLTYTIKMSKMGANKPKDYFEYVVPPLEGLWWMADNKPGIDYGHKDKFCWTSMIRQPEFVNQEIFQWACQELERKKGLDTRKAQLKVLEEGLCVQCMHLGSYDDEPATVEKIESFIHKEGLYNDISTERHHHEIYLADPRRTEVSKLRTVIRVPVRES